MSASRSAPRAPALGIALAACKTLAKAKAQVKLRFACARPLLQQSSQKVARRGLCCRLVALLRKRGTPRCSRRRAAPQRAPIELGPARRRGRPICHVPRLAERAAVPGAAAQPRAAAEPRRAAEPLRRQPAPAKEEARPAARARRHGTVQSGQHVLHEFGVASFSSCPATTRLLRRT